MSLGSLAVDAFFVLSGYLIAASWLRSRGFPSYLRKRVARIYPGFIVMSLFCLALAPAAGQQGTEIRRPTSLATFAARTLTLHPYRDPAIFAPNPIPERFNTSAWTIKFEFYCYFILPALDAVGLLRRSRSLLIVLAAVVVALAFSPAWQTLHPPPFVEGVFGTPIDWLRFGGSFLAGTIFFLWREQIVLKAPLLIFAIAAVLSAIIAHRGLESAVVVCGSYALIWLAFVPNMGAERFARFGDFSYGIYLYAFPLQQLIVLWLGRTIGPMALFFMAWPASIIAGMLSWHLVEKHFLRTSHSRRPAIVATVDSATP